MRITSIIMCSVLPFPGNIQVIGPNKLLIWQMLLSVGVRRWWQWSTQRKIDYSAETENYSSGFMYLLAVLTAPVGKSVLRVCTNRGQGHLSLWGAVLRADSTSPCQGAVMGGRLPVCGEQMKLGPSARTIVLSPGDIRLCLALTTRTRKIRPAAWARRLRPHE